jgi:hypothetical protein
VIVGLSHPLAYDDVVSAMLSRGYLIADVLNWGAGAGASYERSLAMYYALCQGGGLEGYSDVFVKRFNIKAKLKTVQMFDSAGKVILTEQGNVGTIGVGQVQGEGGLMRGGELHGCDEGEWR